MSLIERFDRDALSAQFRRATPFPFFVIDGFLEAAFADELAASFPSFEAAARAGRTFATVNEMGKVQVCNPRDFPAPVQGVADAICAPSFLRDLEYISGIDALLCDPAFAGGGLHETRSRGWLDVHVDFNFLPEQRLFRRLNILIFLNPGWDESWGGELELWDAGVKRRCHSLAPSHNRCVVFETTRESFHGVAAVRCPPGLARKSFAAYYYTREAPRGWDGIHHSTIFRARPDEHLKRYVLMPAERAKRSLREQVRRARRATRGVLGRS